MDIAALQNFSWLFIILAVWEVVWKGLALWRAAQNNEKYWFIAILLINSIGIVPILYLVLRRGSVLKK